jgi:hypothetical protein
MTSYYIWSVKLFKDQSIMNNWITKNKNKYQTSISFINNGWMVEYRKLRRFY